MAQRICSVATCDRPHYGRGYCQMHYQRWRAHGDALFEFEYPVQTCAVEGCERTFTKCPGKGMCSRHYQRVKRHGDPLYLAPRRVGVDLCKVPDCDAVLKANGCCVKHLSRFYRHGSPTGRVRGEVVDGKRICASCGEDVPLEEWTVVGGKFRSCRDCFADYNRMRGHLRRVQIRGDAGTEIFTRKEIFDRDGFRRRERSASHGRHSG